MNSSASDSSAPRQIAMLLGSLRSNSISQSVARALRGTAPPSLALNEVPIGDMPFYNHDLEAQAPQPWQSFRQRILESDGILFVTPEYNRSVPAALKNAIDVGSRPYGKSVWNGKPAAVVTFSPGLLGGFGCNHHLRQSLVCLNVATMPAPEVYLSNAAKLFDANGDLAQPETRSFLTTVMSSFAAWVERSR